MEQYEFIRGLHYADVVAASERVAWTVDEVFRDRSFDAGRPLVPAAWLGTSHLSFLSADEQLVLDHCRAFSYAHLLGNFEEFAPPHVGSVIERGWHDDRARLRALFRFGEEELKHQQLLRRVELALEQSCGHPFARYFDDDKVRVTTLTGAILAHPPLSRFLMVLALEWGTQRHYADSIRDVTAQHAAPLYLDVLKAHWVEEAQHTKADALEIAHLARTMSQDEVDADVDHLAALGGLVDAAFAGQAAAEIDTLRRVTGRSFSDVESTTLHETLHRSLARIFAGVGLGHPRFASVVLALSPRGAAKLGITTGMASDRQPA